MSGLTRLNRKLVLIYIEAKPSKLVEALAERIQRELRESQVFSSRVDKIMHSPEAPYTVVIDDRTLVDGIVRLKHYRPKIYEEVHVSDLKSKFDN